MAICSSSRVVERRRVPQDTNRPSTHPKHSDRAVARVRPLTAERDAYPKDGDMLNNSVLGRFFWSLTSRSATDGRVDGRKMRMGGAL
jgi:hypothetical protein